MVEGNPDVDLNDALGSMCVHTCVGDFHVILVNRLYYSYIHRNKNVAKGGGREIQEAQDICTPMVIHVDVWQKSTDIAQNYP